MTGTTSRIIQAGLFGRSPESPELSSASTILSRLSICFLRCWLVSVATPARSSSASFLMSIRLSSSRTAGAPVSALNMVSPCSRAACFMARNSSSSSSWFGSTSCLPGSMTM